MGRLIVCDGEESGSSNADRVVKTAGGRDVTLGSEASELVCVPSPVPSRLMLLEKVGIAVEADSSGTSVGCSGLSEVSALVLAFSRPTLVTESKAILVELGKNDSAGFEPRVLSAVEVVTFEATGRLDEKMSTFVTLPISGKVLEVGRSVEVPIGKASEEVIVGTIDSLVTIESRPVVRGGNGELVTSDTLFRLDKLLESII